MKKISIDTRNSFFYLEHEFRVELKLYCTEVVTAITAPVALSCDLQDGTINLEKLFLCFKSY